MGGASNDIALTAANTFTVTSSTEDVDVVATEGTVDIDAGTDITLDAANNVVITAATEDIDVVATEGTIDIDSGTDITLDAGGSISITAASGVSFDVGSNALTVGSSGDGSVGLANAWTTFSD